MIEKNKKAILLRKLLDDPSGFLSTIQIGITLAGFFSSASAATTLSVRFYSLISPYNIPYAKEVSMILITIILSFFTLIFGELVPKRIALKKCEKSFFLYPAGQRLHHNYVGGLAHHTLGMLNLANDFAKNFPYLNKDYLFAGGGSYTTNNIYFFANIPTEEIFSAPKKTGVNGKLYSALPLAYNGAIVKDFWFEFKDGQVVDYDAKEGKEVLTSILDTDEGAKYLGEIALVPYGSPISALNTLFYETLIDENASCHFALGASYNECIEGGLKMSEEELLDHGMNQSFTHVDFMVGTSDLSIEATLKNGEKIFVFKDGKYTSEFDEYSLN